MVKANNVVKKTAPNPVKTKTDWVAVKSDTSANGIRYKSFVDAVKIYAENHPEDIVSIVCEVVQGAKSGDPRKQELFIKCFGGFDVQKVDVTSGGEELQTLKVVWPTIKKKSK